MTLPSDPPRRWAASRSELPAGIIAAARDWLAAPELAAVVDAFGGPPAATASIAVMASWAYATLDSRDGRERQEAAPVRYSDHQIDVLHRAGRALGLFATATPALPSYDATVILGGTTVANGLRTALIRDWASPGGDSPPTWPGVVVALASNRPLRPAEYSDRGDGADVGTSPVSEWEDLADVVATAFGPLRLVWARRGEDRDRHRWWVDQELEGPAVRLRVMCAPSTRARRRPDTADALSFLVGRMKDRPPGTVLLVTSAIYAPYTFFVAAPVVLAGWASGIEVVGTATAAGEPMVLAQRVAQEINSTIQAIAALKYLAGRHD